MVLCAKLLPPNPQVLVPLTSVGVQLSLDYVSEGMMHCTTAVHPFINDTTSELLLYFIVAFSYFGNIEKNIMTESIALSQK